jgi:hypothetical protein
MRATWRPLAVWPYPPRKKRPDLFQSSKAATLDKLEDEIGRLNGHELVIGVVTDEASIRIDGGLRADARIRYAGVEVSFEVAGGQRLTFHTDAYPSFEANLRAIALGLEALRAVDRYGITSTAEQYAGFAQLGTGGPDSERGRKLVDERFEGNVARALRATHPDTRDGAYTDRDFADVQAYRESVEPRLGAGTGQ